MTYLNYVPGERARDPLVSPIYADIPTNFPPTILNTGTRELMLSNTLRLFWKLKESGVIAELLVTDGAGMASTGNPTSTRAFAPEVR